MDALISGCAGRALLVDGGSLRSFDVDDPSKLVPRTPADFAYLFGEMQDLRVLENIDIESVRQELKHASDSALALDLVLISLDPDLPDDIRQEAIEGLDELLADARVAERLENILYARPLPEDADLEGALKLCSAGLSSRASDLLQSLKERQSLISEVSDAWDILPSKIFGEEKTEFQHVAVREGLFRALVLNRESQASVNTFLMSALLNPSLQVMRNYRQVLQKWADAFRQENRTPVIRPEMDKLIATESLTKTRQRRRRRSIDRGAVLQNVESQKAMIVNAMRHDELGRVRKFVGELVKYQLKNGEPVFAAKSLCDLAAEAKGLGMFALQVELTEQSTRVKPDDAWSWRQHADALLSSGQPAEALRAYEQADAFGGGAVAKNGRADTLKALGRLNDALDAYDAVIADYPENDVARGGRADTLKALGRLNDALDAYDAVIADYPENVVSRNGRADTLKALGRLNDALDAYDAIIADYPENGISRRGRSCVLAALQRYDEALADLPSDAPRTPGDWIGFHIRGMIMLRRGDIDEAIRIFQRGVEDDPIPLSKQYFHTALSVALMRHGEYRSARKILSNVEAQELQPQVNVLLIHCFGEDDQTAEASEAFENISAKPWSISGELIEELHRRYVLKQPPQRSDDWVFDQEIGSILVVANQQAPISNYLS
jgi:tetratricopeptide (TPR) repeat protein